MRLHDLFPNGTQPVPNIEVRGLAWDSRRVRPGDLFFALPGQKHDGHEFIPQAISRGAVAIVGEGDLTGLPVPYIRVEDARAALAQAAAAFYGHPTRKLTVIGVTGTNGKTTVVHLLGQLLPECATLTTVRVEEEGLEDRLVVVGGVIPKDDIPKLKALGVKGVFPGGTPLDEIVRFIRENAPKRG